MAAVEAKAPATSATQTHQTSSKKAAPSRPPARPQARSSRHALEPNPFEQSFSSKPSSSASPENHDPNAHPGNEKTKADAPNKMAAAADRKAGKPAANKANDASASAGPASATTNKEGVETSTPGGTNKRMLPSVASLTSPSNEGGSSYPWTGGLGSLRSGPLSPAMLTGPQGHHPFDPSSFRTGFTPDLSNFKTGLTPLGSAGGYPMPSPGTVNFLNMINSGAAMTPNTLNALTSVAGDHQPPYSDMRSGHSANGSADYNLSLERQGNGRTPNGPPSSFRGKDGEGAKPPQHPQQPSGPGGVPGVAANGPNGQPSTSQAASGLFLLSQAHQELSKRGAGAPGSMQPPPIVANEQQGGAKGAPNNKRKKAPAGPSGPPAASPVSTNGAASNKSSPNTGAAGMNGVKPSKKAKSVKDEEQKDELEGSDDEFDEDGKDFGDDEEKRKNFLERNRQAALKCRQRKKAWLQDLQAKVAYFENENGNLQGMVGALRNEVMFLKSQLMQAQQVMQSKGVSMPGPMGGIPAPMGQDGSGMLPPGMGPMHHPGMHPHHPGPPMPTAMPQGGVGGGYPGVPGMPPGPHHGGGVPGAFSSPAQGHPKPQPA